MGNKLNADCLHGPLRRGLLVLMAVLGMGLALVQSLSVAVPWWRGELEAGMWEWLWIGLLPVWVFVFIRYFSIFRPDCNACAVRAPENSRRGSQ